MTHLRPDGVRRSWFSYREFLRILSGAFALASATSAIAQNTSSDALGNANTAVARDLIIHVPASDVPFSSLASQAAKQNLLEFLERLKKFDSNTSDTVRYRRQYDDILMRPSMERLRAVFAVQIVRQTLGGVPTDVITPSEGISARNVQRVLVNLHGGGFLLGGGGPGGQLESVPIASLGRIKVITVDYRQGPEHRFPAASEDVASVYRELLKRYRPENIGIYGCSAGGWLTAESVAWFQTHGLPRPGAVGIFAGALPFDGITGDSAYMGWALSTGAAFSGEPLGAFKIDYFDVPGLDMEDAAVSPIRSPDVISKFPPTLIISGTRDFLLSQAVYTHAQLVKAGVDADFHIWEGTYHCWFALWVDPGEPETREAWDVIVRFFESRLGHRSGEGR